jgi:hypothetical protein
VKKILEDATYSEDTLPGLKDLQSTLPLPSIHSSPRIAQNSSSVRPGGRRRTSTFFPVAEDLLFLVASPAPLLAGGRPSVPRDAVEGVAMLQATAGLVLAVELDAAE